jgi:hypothetical protein
MGMLAMAKMTATLALRLRPKCEISFAKRVAYRRFSIVE